MIQKTKQKNKAPNHNLLSDHTMIKLVGVATYMQLVLVSDQKPIHCQYTRSMQYMCRMRSGDKTNVICLALFPGHVGTRLGICAVEQLYIHLYKINCLRVCTMAHAMWTVSKWARACIYVSRWYHGNKNNNY